MYQVIFHNESKTSYFGLNDNHSHLSSQHLLLFDVMHSAEKLIILGVKKNLSQKWTGQPCLYGNSSCVQTGALKDKRQGKAAD
ncbi:MAG: hypothetical protein Q7T96_08415 [Methylobacter sp.]|nr:hypothetical protein [Methylobacter sp.]